MTHSLSVIAEDLDESRSGWALPGNLLVWRASPSSLRHGFGGRPPTALGPQSPDQGSTTLLGVRLLGIDFGTRRIGLALSDASGILASPWTVIAAAAAPRESAARLADFLKDQRADDEAAQEIAAIVVGVPRRLSGEDTDQSAAARVFASELGAITGLPVHLQDERLSSREAESRLAVRERDWRARKAKLDAAAAAIILQDYLDGSRT
jgi:putative Holliday junction resolvase